jgi:DNA polymerase theta
LQELDDNVASMKQCINHHGGSEAVEVWLCLNKSILEPFLYFSFFLLNFSLCSFQQEPFEGEQVSCVGFSALQRCSFTPSTAQRKVGFSLAPVETLKSVSRNSLTSPGEEFWNAAIELADGISAQADKVCGRPEFDAAEDKSSCAVAVCSKTLCRSGRDELDCQNTVGSNDTHHMEKLSNKVESLAVNSQHIINSPLPVKQLDFFHEDDIKVSCSKFEAKGSYEACNAQADHVPLKDSGLLGKENLKDPVDVMKKSANNLHTDSAAMRCQGVFKSTIEGKVHPTQEGERDSHLIRRDHNQRTHNENKSLAAYSNNCKTWIDSNSKFASEEVEASTPTSSIPLKDHSKLSSWLPPELCAMYMKKGISELYPWQVRILFPNYLFNKSLAASFLSLDHFCLC